MSSAVSLPASSAGLSALSPWQRALLFAAAYFLVAEIGRFLSVRDSIYISFWLPAGLYVAVLLVNETRAWPWLVLAAFAGNLAFDLAHGTSLVVALLFCVTNAFQSVISAWLVRRYVARQPGLLTLKEFFGFMGIAALLGSMIGATMGATTLTVFGLSASFVQSWKVWWGSNAMAILLVSPFLLTWVSPANAGRLRDMPPWRLLEAAAMVALLFALTWHLLFMDRGIMAPDKARMVLPLLWAALRFSPRGAAAANLLLAVLVAFFTTQTFAGLTPGQIASGEYVFVMQTTLAVAALVGLVPAIALAELRESEERSRHLSRRLIEAEENERRNINRELHDRVGQNLATLSLNLGMIRSELPGETLRAVGARMNDSHALLGDTMERVRNLMAELRPVALDDYGLVAALRTYAADFSKRFGTGVSVVGNDPVPRLPLPAETALFRIAQEALNNVSKHARATAVEIRIEESKRRVLLSIADDGMGFEVPKRQPAAAQSWGMATMRERAEAVGAALTIKSAPGRGTRVEVILPRAPA
ncbi:MAG TPA: MASE1 domain-containing protein [Burkholderiales bacterium]|nr:MASE1 domain-containing protein [Burkholderiales bacterium]